MRVKAKSIQAAAVQYDGTNAEEVQAWLIEEFGVRGACCWTAKEVSSPMRPIPELKMPVLLMETGDLNELPYDTTFHKVQPGQWIVVVTEGRFTVEDDAEFRRIYEVVEE